VEAGWLTSVALNLQVSGSPVGVVGRALVQYPHPRICVATVGDGAANLFATMQLHRLSDLDLAIQQLLAEYPGVIVLGTRVVLRCVKSWGRLPGPDGHAEKIVPVDLWAPAG
jgi:hypothetical protein